jgi:hypothetical protein
MQSWGQKKTFLPLVVTDTTDQLQIKLCLQIQKNRQQTNLWA